MKVCFLSNYINHHQIPFCDAMFRELDGSFIFIQTMKMEKERVSMGWHEEEVPEYVHLFYEEEDFCKRYIAEADVVLFGGLSDESYIRERLEKNCPIIRVDERMYKEGQWKAISPRGLLKKYRDHTKYRKAPVYFLCAGAYVASDLEMIHAYPGKKFCWGYFPPTKKYDIEKLLAKKQGEVPKLLWAGRFIDWKHPDYPLQLAKYLKEKGIDFRLTMIGGGELEEKLRGLLKEYGLEELVLLPGYQPPEQVREAMEEATVFLMTSDRREGWGAVANEAMNSGCVLVADHMTGAAPCLIRQGENGFLYESGHPRELFETVEKILRNREQCGKIGKNAYNTICETWNSDYAAKKLMELIREVVLANREVYPPKGQEFLFAPCAPAPILKERRIYKQLTKER